MAEHMSEQEILKLLKKLDQESNQLHEEHQEAGYSGQNVEINDKIIDGFIKVEHGKIIVGNPSNGGRIPIINAKLPVRLYIDGQEAIGETKVSSASNIEWRIEEKPLFEITVSEDKLEAYLTINRTRRHAWILKEVATTLYAVLRAEEDPTIILETVYLQDVLSAVEKMNIKMNLDIAMIQAEILNPSFKPIKFAYGKAPVQGQHAQLNLFFSENIESIFNEVKGSIDYKNHMNIPSVKNGDVIARKTPLVEGTAGYDVYGNVLLPDPVNDIRIVAKQNVEITPEAIAIARKEGRPRITGNKIKYLDINTTYIVPGDVDLHTGNIVFAGDVVVYGDVTDNMIIESLGNIYISGSVFNSTLTATGSIAVQGNVIGSNLYSGYFGMLYNRLYNTSNQLIQYIEKMLVSTKMLLAEIGKKNKHIRYGQVLVLLIESKYNQMPEIVKEMLSVISSIQSLNKEAMQQLKYYLELSLHPAKIVEVMTAARLEDFLRILRETFMRIALSQEAHVQININQSQNSTLKSNGDILIRKEGVIQCDLYSAGNIIFFLDNSVCRGSKLEAGDTISAMYVGGITGVGTTLKAAKKVMIKKMFEGRVCIDRSCIDIFEPIEDKTFE
ncbi:FapA family protein [Paenibacillus abyssi]|uniref:Flagellar Assembly Protein A N-terminal region domain-containing protein n=1 Tax=Paenibacillus abyssi TaxID=1340531 RepID=A0A917CW36_9BACL|nr:FapA family protein [Paenibacillus abyssi]GGF98642.1 hypothetical protein GCM10010916_14840 [Paenibacillus abyssi]